MLKTVDSGLGSQGQKAPLVAIVSGSQVGLVSGCNGTPFASFFGYRHRVSRCVTDIQIILLPQQNDALFTVFPVNLSSGNCANPSGAGQGERMASEKKKAAPEEARAA